MTFKFLMLYGKAKLVSTCKLILYVPSDAPLLLQLTSVTLCSRTVVVPAASRALAQFSPTAVHELRDSDSRRRLLDKRYNWRPLSLF